MVTLDHLVSTKSAFELLLVESFIPTFVINNICCLYFGAYQAKSSFHAMLEQIAGSDSFLLVVDSVDMYLYFFFVIFVFFFTFGFPA